ncbi:MAG: SusC/RagA family TonB-linked outer membrane protein [Mucilaginibacter sp.]
MSFNVFAQNTFVVKGVVKDDKGITLPSVTVKLKGSAITAAADVDGRYQISLPDGNGTLVFSFIGFDTKEVPVNQSNTVNVTLQPATNSLNEVVVVGYGTQKKSDLTGAISSISEKDIKDNAVSNVSELLQGRAAGVFVSTGSGQPGQNSVVRIRGFGTVNSNDPIYVVDGQIFNNINSVNPNDILNIEVLKDASATSIYGSRGSNGVILVTTKKGTSGETITSVDAYVGQKTSSGRYDMANSSQFYNFVTAAYKNSGQTLDPKFTQQYNRGFDTDWWDATSQKGLSQNYDVSVRSGGPKSRSFYSLGYYDDKGSIITTRYKRITLKINNEYDVSSKITLGVNIGLVNGNTVDPGNLYQPDPSSTSNVSKILNADPFTPVINPLVSPGDPNYQYDKYAPTEWAFDPNPVSTLEINKRNSKELNMFGNVNGRLKIVKGLDYYVQYDFENNHNDFSLFNPQYHSVFSPYNLANINGKFLDQTQLANNSSEVNNHTIQQRLNYNNNIGKHSISAMVAMTYESDESQGLNAFKTNAPGNDPSFQVLDAATLNAQASGGKTETSILSYLGRVNYSYDNRYLATVNFRADGSSIFADGHKWGYFPSFSLGWRLSNEDFFKNSGLAQTISDLKLRAGWGQTGNQNISNTAALNLIGTGSDRQYYFGSGYSQGYYPIFTGNPDIKWEVSQQTNVGLDAGFFNQRLTISADYYIKKTQGMLLQVPVPAIAGYANYPFTNAGDVQNKGFESTINYKNTIGKLGYFIGGNISFYKTKVTNLGNGNLPLYGSVSKTEVGGPMGRFFGYKYEGIFQNAQEIADYKGPQGQVIQPYAKPGDFKFADLNHDGVLDDKDRTYIGNPNPSLIYGFNLGASYGGFDFSASFQGVVGNDIWNSAKGYANASGQNILADAYTKAWTKEGDNASYPRIALSNDNNNLRGSSWFVESGSYLRLQNFQLGYSLPQQVMRSLGLMNSCRIYVSGQNLFTITKYSGPDADIGQQKPLNLGFDPIRYPSARTIMVGVNAQF